MAGKYQQIDKSQPIKVKKMTCMNCGAGLDIRAMGYTKSLACQFCGTLHDLSKEKTEITYIGKKNDIVKPFIPLGTRGKLHGAIWEVIGFSEREGKFSNLAGPPFRWHEYLLFNPYKGFRWLTEFQGHWNYVLSLHEIPKNYPEKTIYYLNEAFNIYETYQSTVTYVVGEFYWTVKVGDKSLIQDYVHQNQILSLEKTITQPALKLSAPPAKDESILHIGGEIDYLKQEQIKNNSTAPIGKEINQVNEDQIWSLADYIAPKEIEEAFGVRDLPSRSGIVVNQPMPGKNVLGPITKISMLGAAALFCLATLFSLFNHPKLLLNDSFQITSTKQQLTHAWPYALPQTEVIHQYRSPSFEIHHQTGVVALKAKTNLQNAWVEFEASLVNEQTGKVKKIQGGLEYYKGYHYEDGSWVEGSNQDQWQISALPEGKYHLLINTESSGLAPITMQIQLVEGLFSFDNLLFSFILILIPAGLIIIYWLYFDWRKYSELEEE